MEKAPSFRNYDKSKRANPYGWDYYLHGKRMRVTFKTKAEKTAYLKEFTRKWYGDRDALLNFDAIEYRRVQSLIHSAGSTGPGQGGMRGDRVDVEVTEFIEAVQARFGPATVQRMSASSGKGGSF